jgi:aminoglycoside phosphotransferase family enzyme
MVDGKPTIFGVLEFKESLAITDTQYVLAYVPIDLLHRDRRAQACLFLSRYPECRPVHDGLTLLPLFVSVRAAVRAKVSLSIAVVQHTEAAAQSWSFAAALAPSAM